MNKIGKFGYVEEVENEEEREWSQKIRLPLSKATYDFISAERNMQSDSLEDRMQMLFMMMATFQINPNDFKKYLNRKWMK